MPMSSVEAVEHKTRANIEQLIQRIWVRRIIFSCTVGISAMLVIMWAFFAPRIYVASVTLIPRQENGAPGALQSVLGEMSTSAALLGLNVGMQVNQQEAIAALKSRALFQQFAADHRNLLAELFPHDWDPTLKMWQPEKKVPTMNDAWRLFRLKIREVDYDKENDIVTLAVRWTNRFQAAQWANQLVTLVNQRLRESALQQTQASLRSLDAQVQKTKSIELKSAIYQLMEEQISKEVMARSTPSYAFTVIDPAVAPDADNFVSPRRRLLLAIAIPLGLMVGVVVVLSLDLFGELMDMLMRARELELRGDRS